MRVVGLALGLGLIVIGSPALAQEFRYSVYLDTDGRQTSGCSESYAPGTVRGAELRLNAYVGGEPERVQRVTLAPCAGSNFGIETDVGGGFPVALNAGPNGTDSIELALNGA